MFKKILKYTKQNYVKIVKKLFQTLFTSHNYTNYNYTHWSSL